MGILMSSSTVPSFWHLRKLFISASEWQTWNSNPDNSLFYFLVEKITRTTGQRLLILLKLWRLPHLSWIMENWPSYNPDHFLFCTLMRKIREKLSNSCELWLASIPEVYMTKPKSYILFSILFSIAGTLALPVLQWFFFSSVTHLKEWFCLNDLLSHTPTLFPQKFRT